MGAQVLIRESWYYHPQAVGQSQTWSEPSLIAFIEQLFLLNAWSISKLVTWNIPSWSISAEAVAYLSFPFLAALIARWRTPTLATLALSIIAFYAWIGSTTGILDIVKGIAILRCLAGFSLGMILYSFRNQLQCASNMLLGLAQLVGVIIVLGTLLLGLNDVFAIPGFFLLVATTLADRGWLAKLLSAPLLHWLGLISYSVYLNHFWVLRIWYLVAVRLLPHLGLSPLASRGVFIVGGITLVVAISNLSYRYIEGPARKAIINWYQRRSTHRQPPDLHVENRLT